MLMQMRKLGKPRFIVTYPDTANFDLNTPLVVHCKRNPFDVYIGRNPARSPINPFGNPVPMESESMREFAVYGYCNHLLLHHKLQTLVCNKLAGKIQGCWCAPRLCHGHANVWWIEHHQDVHLKYLRIEREDGSYHKPTESPDLHECFSLATTIDLSTAPTA
jgi:hypothetical protein